MQSQDLCAQKQTERETSTARMLARLGRSPCEETKGMQRGQPERERRNQRADYGSRWIKSALT